VGLKNVVVMARAAFSLLLFFNHYYGGYLALIYDIFLAENYSKLKYFF